MEREYFQKAYDGNNSYAAYALGKMYYENGDKEKALFYLGRAAEKTERIFTGRAYPTAASVPVTPFAKPRWTAPQKSGGRLQTAAEKVAGDANADA